MAKKKNDNASDPYPREFRIAFHAVTSHAESYNLYLPAEVREDLASEAIVIYYRHCQESPGKYVDFRPIVGIAANLVLEHIRTADRSEPVRFDELAATPLFDGDDADCIAAIDFVMACASPTERRILESFLQSRSMDYEQVAELTGHTPANVSKYLYKLRQKVRSSLFRLARVAADQIVAEPDVRSRAEYSLLSMSRSKGHEIEFRTAIMFRLEGGSFVGSSKLIAEYAPQIRPVDLERQDPELVVEYAFIKMGAGLILLDTENACEQQFLEWGELLLDTVCAAAGMSHDDRKRRCNTLGVEYPPTTKCLRTLLSSVDPPFPTLDLLSAMEQTGEQ